MTKEELAEIKELSEFRFRSLCNANYKIVELELELKKIKKQDDEYIRVIEHVQMNMIEQQDKKKTQHEKSLNAACLVAADLLLEKFKEIRGMK